MMKALVLDRAGGPETMRMAELPKPEPGEGEVLVKVAAVGLNPVDYKLGERGHPAWSYPFILGLDVAGTIDALGPGVSGWKVGDRVYYHGDLTKPGGFAEWAVAMTPTLASLPENLSFTEAAAIPCAGFTAYQVLYDKLKIKSGQTILIHGGAGGVGGFAVQLAALEGLKVITTCSPKNFEWVRKLGASEAIDYNTEDIAARVSEITNGRGVDAIVDTISAASATAGLKMLAFNGAIACVVGLPDLSAVQSPGKGISIHDINLSVGYKCGELKGLEELGRMGTELATLVSNGKVKSLLQQVVSLAEIPEVQVRLSEGHVRGKIVAQIS